ncbi:protein Tex24-like [Grammomys surdaster]|uniref:protein Tex24-like n=1 Tax=Grammomys surdaster TaxID=491861 RepID=UPI00109F5933|nr:protein Tex24-like [Grammomys surdaster]
MCSQRLDPLFLKSSRLQYIGSNERSLEHTSRLTIGPKAVTLCIKDLRVVPGSGQSLDNQQHRQAELPSTSHGKKKPDRLPCLKNCASKDHAPDPKLSLLVVSKRIFQGDSVIEGPESRQTFVGHTDLLKNSPEATAGEAQGKKRTMALLSKARKQTEKASNPVDTRQVQKQEVVMDTEHPSKKHQQQQQKILEDLRRGYLGGGDKKGLIQSQEPFRYHECLALEKNTFVQGKKIEPYSRHLDQVASPLLVGEQESGKELKSVPSGSDELKTTKTTKNSKGKKTQTQFLESTSRQGKEKVMGQNLLEEAKPGLLKRKKMQAMEMMAKPHRDRGLRLENSREEVQFFIQDVKQGALERNIIRPKRWPKEEGWDHRVQGTPVVFAVRDHTNPPQGSKESAPKSRVRLSNRKPRIVES